MLLVLAVSIVAVLVLLSFVVPLGGDSDDDQNPDQAIAPEAEAQIAALSELHDSGGLSDEAFVRAQIEIRRDEGDAG